MQGYWIYPPLQVLVVFGRYSNKFFPAWLEGIGHVSSTYVRMMDLGLRYGLGPNRHSAAEESREFITLGVSNRTNTIELLLSSTWNAPAHQFLPTPRPCKRKAGVIAR